MPHVLRELIELTSYASWPAGTGSSRCHNLKRNEIFSFTVASTQAADLTLNLAGPFLKKVPAISLGIDPSLGCKRYSSSASADSYPFQKIVSARGVTVKEGANSD